MKFVKHIPSVSMVFAVIVGICLNLSSACAAEAVGAFVRDGQFKDLILPVPIVDSLETEGIWGNENVIPRDKHSGIEDNEWCYWGGNPVRGKDGRYHMAVCRWAESTGHHGWFESEVAHCVSSAPTGPYKITKAIVKKGHNPEVMVMPDGDFVLHVMDSSVYQAKNMPGPWKRIGRMRMHARDLRPSDRMGSNLTTEFRPDGSILLMKKDGDIGISRKGILGPYKLVSIENYSRSTGYPQGSGYLAQPAPVSLHLQPCTGPEERLHEVVGRDPLEARGGTAL